MKFYVILMLLYLQFILLLLTFLTFCNICDIFNFCIYFILNLNFEFIIEKSKY